MLTLENSYSHSHVSEHGNRKQLLKKIEQNQGKDTLTLSNH